MELGQVGVAMFPRVWMMSFICMTSFMLPISLQLNYTVAVAIPLLQQGQTGMCHAIVTKLLLPAIFLKSANWSFARSCFDYCCLVIDWPFFYWAFF